MKQHTAARLGKTALSLLLVGVLLIGCASCKTLMPVRFQNQDDAIIGNSNSGGIVEQPSEAPAANTEIAAPSQSASSSTEVSSINLELDEGILKYVRFEKLSAEVLDKPNAYLFVFEYTNKQTEPAQAQDTFYVEFYQNGTEIQKANGFIAAGEQGALASAFYNKALQGGTVTFGEIVLLNDASPVTIYAKRNIGKTDDHQSMVVTLDSVTP